MLTSRAAQLEAHQRDMENAANQTAQLNAFIAQLKVQHTAELDSYTSKVRNLEMDLDQLRIRLRVTSEELDRTKAQLVLVNEACAPLPDLSQCLPNIGVGSNGDCT